MRIKYAIAALLLLPELIGCITPCSDTAVGSCERMQQIKTGDGVQIPTKVEQPATESERASENTQNEIREGSWQTVTFTAYCACEKCCGVWALNRPNGIVYGAGGYELIPGQSIATNNADFPMGSKVEIKVGDEIRFFTVDDCGGVEGGLDIYFASHEEAVQFGMKDLPCRVAYK